MKKFAITLLLTGLLTACGDADKNDNSITLGNSDNAEVENTVKVEEVGMPFQALTGRFFTLEAPLQSYTIDVRLKSAAGTGSSEFSETTPPMPVVVGGISFLQAAGSYLVKIPGDDETKNLGKPFLWSRVTIACDGGATSIYVNGEYHSMSAACPELTKDVRVGRGFAQRFWEGRMEYFDIYAGDQTSALFNDNLEADTGSKVFSLDQFNTDL